MYDVSDLWLNSIRYGGGWKYGYVEAWLGGTRIEFDGKTYLPLNVDGQNAVEVDGSTPGVRRTGGFTLPKDVGLWDALAPVGTELRAYTAIRYQSGDVEAIPQGVFDVDAQSIGYSASGDLKLTAPDRWARVQRAQFLVPRAIAAGASVKTTIATLIEEAVPGVSTSIETTSTATVPSAQVEDRDRAGLIEKLAAAASLDVFFDRSGTPVIRDVPTIQPTWVWEVDASPTGVMMDAQRQRDRRRTFNIVVVIDTRNDGTAPLPPMFVWDANPDSPTYAGSGSGASTTAPSAGTAGPLGQRPTFLRSPLYVNAAQQIAAGQTRLAKVSGLNAQLDTTSAPNPALDDGDTILATFPRERWDKAQVRERHILDSFTVPIVWHKSPMPLSTRSTVADLPED